MAELEGRAALPGSEPGQAVLGGLMMEQALLVSGILRHAGRWHGPTAIVSRQHSGAVERSSWEDVARRASSLANALQALGVSAGDRVATLAWNSARHLELYYAVPGIGAVLHTVNPRLFAEQIAFIVAEANDRIVFIDPQLLPLANQLAAHLPGVRHWIVLCDAAELAMAAAAAGAASEPAAAMHLPGVRDYESFIAGFADAFDWPELDERAAAGLCYTSGTTGNPKGVLYSHRSTVLHAMATVAPDALGLSARDVVLPVVPMFHVNAWGLPYSCGMAGAGLVLPGSRLDGDNLFDLMASERVTLAVGVPTVWLGLLDTFRSRKAAPPGLQRLVVGGSACPPAMADAYRQEFGVHVVQGWGMTETSPFAVVSSPTLRTPPEALATLCYRQGRPPFGVDLEIVDGEGRPLPHDGKVAGDLLVRGHWVARAYFKGAAEAELLRAGWFPTGDVANIDAEGMIQITDRSKDVIKSGGEWISSIDLENAALLHPGVQEAAAIGLPHPRWGERPLLLVVCKPGADVDAEGLRAVLATRVARWWLPDEVIFVPQLPHTATGKLSKVSLRSDYREYRFPDSSPS